MASAPIYVLPYFPSWPKHFEAERAWLEQVLAPWLVGSIEHIGSTAIPGLAAKPVIDIMVGVADLPSSRPAIEALRELQYVHWPYQPDAMHWFCKPSDARRTHHLHLIPYESPHWVERLAFRDYLRSHPNVAAQYASLKRRLALRHRNDREAYTDAKAPFIEKVIEIANRHSPRRSARR
jgi:GrpB-like predicted nucleotidyltransferase (UPF0157 family)